MLQKYDKDGYLDVYISPWKVLVMQQDSHTASPVLSLVQPRGETRQMPPYNVVLLDDDDHSEEYVMIMLQELFGYPHEAGFQRAREVDREGRAILLTTHREKAELKREQIHAYGPDQTVATCRGSMSAIIEPANAPDA
jgi:ATP-dependent Clp protease adaptor protein ClpS